MTNEAHRRQTAEMAIIMGKALEHVAICAGSTSHLFSNF